MKHIIPNEFEVGGVFTPDIYQEIVTTAAKTGCKFIQSSGTVVRLQGNRQKFAFSYPHAQNVQDVYDHDAECEEQHMQDIRRLRTDANRFLRQRNELLQKMKLILTCVETWNGGWVGKGKDSKVVLEDIYNTASLAIKDLESNGQ